MPALDRCRVQTAGRRQGRTARYHGRWGEILRHGDDGQIYDAHCPSCGSLLYSLDRDGQYVHVAMGKLVDELPIKPSMHIFVGSKAPWFEITDELPQFEAFPDYG